MRLDGAVALAARATVVSTPRHEDTTRLRLHASCVAVGELGVVLIGRSGSGKSDLALRLIDAGARLVADDQLEIERCGEALIGRAPGRLRGLLEVRGFGIVRLPHCGAARLALVVALEDAETVPRLPETPTCRLLGIELPLLHLDARAASACAKVRLALDVERLT